MPSRHRIDCAEVRVSGGKLGERLLGEIRLVRPRKKNQKKPLIPPAPTRNQPLPPRARTKFFIPLRIHYKSNLKIASPAFGRNSNRARRGGRKEMGRVPYLETSTLLFLGNARGTCATLESITLGLVASLSSPDLGILRRTHPGPTSSLLAVLVRTPWIFYFENFYF